GGVGGGPGPVQDGGVADEVVVRRRRGGRAEPIALAGTGDVQDLDFRVLETGGGVEEGFVDPLGPGGSAGDDEHGSVIAESELGPEARPGGFVAAVEAGDLTGHGHADEGGAGKLGIGEGDADPAVAGQL